MPNQHKIHELPLGVQNLLGHYPQDEYGTFNNNIANGGGFIPNGSGSYDWRSASGRLIGIANTWSVSIVGHLTTNQSPSTTDVLFDCESTTSGNINNKIIVQMLGATANDPIQIQLADSAGAVFKDYLWDRPISPATLFDTYSFIITWDGTTLLLYKNGIVQTPTTLTTDDAGTMTDTARDVSNLCLVKDGTLDSAQMAHSTAIWSSALTANEVAQLQAGGMHRNFDFSTNFADYVSSGTLQHWWRINEDPTSLNAIFQDYVKNPPGGTGAINMNGVTAAITPLTTGAFGPNDETSRDLGAASMSFAVGSAENMRNTTNNTYGIANAWSFGTWIRFNGNAATAGIFHARATGDQNNEILIQMLGATATDQLNIIVRNSAGATIKDYKWDFFLNTVNGGVGSASLIFVVFTWDGTTLSTYRNGWGPITPTTKTTDIAGTMTDTARELNIACVQGGGSIITASIHYIALWSTALSASDIRTVFNMGFPTIDLSKNRLGYSGGDNLKHWWRLTEPPGSVGAGTGTFSHDRVATGGINAETNATNITAADIFNQTSIMAIGNSMKFNAVSANDGTWLGTDTARNVGIGNTWTIGITGLLSTVAANGKCFSLDGTGNGGNSIFINKSSSSSRLVLILTDSTDTIFWEKEYNSVFFTANTSCMYITCNAGTAVVYDGSGNVVAASVTTTNSATPMTDTPRAAWLGASKGGANPGYQGWISSVAVWNTAFTQANIRALAGCYRSGIQDLRKPCLGTAYTAAQAAALQHYYMPGADPYAPGKDYCNPSTGAINMESIGPGVYKTENHAFSTYGNDG